MNEHRNLHWRETVVETDVERYRRAGFGRSTAWSGRRPLLLIIDVQYQTTGPAGMSTEESMNLYPRSCGEWGWDAVGHIRELLTAAREAALPVAYAAVAEQAGPSGRLGQKAPNRVYAGEAYDIVEEVAPAAGERVFRKTAPSPFFGTLLTSHLIDLGCDTVVLAGCTTSGCIRAAAVDAFSYNYRVLVPEDAVYDRSWRAHCANLFDLDQKYGDVVGQRELLRYLTEVGSARAG